MSEIKEDGSERFHYDDPEFPIFCRHNYIPAGINLRKYTPVHWHDEIEMIYIASGKIHHTVNDRYFTLHAGDGLFINARQFHELITDQEADCELYCLIFNPLMLENCLRIQKMIRSVTENERLPYLVLKEDIPWHQEFVRELIGTVERNRLANHDRNEFEMMMSVYRILALLQEHTDAAPLTDPKDNQEQQLLKSMLQYIQQHYKEPVTLTDICQAGNIGKTKCSALFKQYLRTTPIQYLRGFRIDRSIYYLRETDLNASEIAFEVGFESASYYSEIFRQGTGMTPLEMRKLLREDADTHL